MAKKGFNVSVASGNAAGFSNIPGASAYSVTFGKQFAKAFQKGKEKGKKSLEKAQSNVAGSVPDKQDTTAAEATPTKTKTTKAKSTESTGKLGSFTVKTGTDGVEQVKTRSKTITLSDIKSKKYEGPIKPENIPGSYKPQGPAPTSRQWSEADKAALESERPKGYVSPTFKPEPDTPENVARRRAEVMEATKPKSRNTETPKATKPKKAPTAKSSMSKQFTPGSQDYSGRTDIVQTKYGPAVDLTGF